MSIDLVVNNLLNSIEDGVETSASKPPIAAAVNTTSELAVHVEIGSSKAAVVSKLPASSVENGLSKPPVEIGANVVSYSAVEIVKKSSLQVPTDSGVNNVLSVRVDNVESLSVKSSSGNIVSNLAIDGAESSSSNPFVEGLSVKEDMIEEHTHWKKTIDFLDSDPFLHHVNEYSNRFNNSHQIVRHQSRPCIRPQALTTITCAFGNLMAPKLPHACSNPKSTHKHQVKCLEDSKLCVRQKALLWINELVATPQGRYQCIKTGLVKALTKRFNEQDMFIKQQVALAAGNLAGMQDACAEMSRLGVIKWLLKMYA